MYTDLMACKKGDKFMNELESSYKRVIMMVVIGVFLSLSSINPIAAAPGEATLISPDGSIDERNPTYTWNEAEDSLWYLLLVEDSSGTVFEHSYKADEVTSDDGICSVTPCEVLSPGDYSWRIQTGNCDEDEGPLSEDMSFSICGSTAKPGRATLISPKGTIGTFNPTFTWNPVADCTRYFLKVTGPAGYTYGEWHDAEEVTADTICTLPAPEELDPGDYTWQIRTGNCIGDGPWSAIVSFKIVDKAPTRVSTILPRGLVSTRTPLFIWSAVPGSTQYRLLVENDTDEIINVPYSAEEVTRGYRCSVLSPIILPDDDPVLYWRVQASNDVGDGPWSSIKYFEVVCGTSGALKEQKAPSRHLRRTVAKDAAVKANATGSP